MKSNFPKVVVQKQLHHVYKLRISSQEEVVKLVQSPWIKFMDRGDRKPVEEKSLGAFDITLNKIPAVRKLYAVNGDGLSASVKEKPFDREDIDFKGRVIVNDQFDEASSVHATLMATIIGGAGNSEPSGRGAAPAALLTTSDFSQLLPDNGNVLTNLGVSVQNHSYGVGVENYYGIESHAYDQHCLDFPSLLHVFSSGNDGDKAGTGAYAALTGFANLTGQFKVSKNTLCVGSADIAGNVTTRSSRGPAHDGRIKPELIAYGDAGSSDAAAVVSGIALLVQQQYKDQYGNLPTAALVRAVLINSADDVDKANVDFETGFGNADAVGAVRTIDEENFFSGSVPHNGENVHTIQVPANTYQLKVTLAWNDVEAAPNASTALIHDLDLVVRRVSSGEEWKPWVLNPYPRIDSLTKLAKRKEDHLNNVEQVTLQLPASGDYEIIVKGFNLAQGPQSYSVAFETEAGFEWSNPLTESSFSASNVNFIRWRWSNAAATGKLEYKAIDRTDWVLINNTVSLSGQYFSWIPPDSTFRLQIRMTVNSNVYESGVFTVIKPVTLKVGYNCPEEVLLVWNKNEGADQYKLFSLGEKYMEELLVTSDTFAILSESQKDVLHYAVVPTIGGMNGLAGSTIDYTQVGTQCYFISFLPRQYVVTEDAIFDLTIGSTYKLETVVLERADNGSPATIQEISPISTNFALIDSNPEPGRNLYRVRLVDENQNTVFTSEYEEIFYARGRDIFVFPNPVLPGEALNIVVNDLETIRLRLYDAMGRLLEERTDEGAVKTIDTATLIRGTYMIEVVKSNGARLTSRLIVL